jgi:hypothetical protein
MTRPPISSPTGDVGRTDGRADDSRAYPAEKAREGVIILRHRWSRAIFIAGLAAGAIFAIVLSVAY